MSCIFSYWSSHASEWSGSGGLSVARGTNCGDAKCHRWSPWTKCGSCAWSGGTIHGCHTWSGGPLIVWQADWSCYVKWVMSQSMKVDQWVSPYWFLALLLQHGLFLRYYSTSDFQLLTACCNNLSQYGWFSYSSLLPAHKVSELTSQTMQLSTMKIWPVQGVLWLCSLESQLVVSIVWIIWETLL